MKSFHKEDIMNQIPKYYTVDLGSVTDFEDFHDIIAEALDFPDYYGCNLDALWDCLTSIPFDIHIEFLNFDRMEKVDSEYAKKILETLSDLKHYDNDEYIDCIIIEIVRGDRREFIE
jgi:ribonuclease inhibitor